jgi:hypothetical protein
MFLLLNNPRLKGDDGCVMFLGLLAIGTGGFVATIAGLIMGLIE